MRLSLSAMPVILCVVFAVFPGVAESAPIKLFILGGILLVAHYLAVGVMLSAEKVRMWVAITQRHQQLRKQGEDQ